MKFKRIIVIVLDGVGVGASPDAYLYGDEGSNSIGNTSRAVNGLNLPNLQKIGIGNITDIVGVPPTSTPQGAYGKLQEKSAGKDTITGHWELMGIHLEKPLPTYPDGFPPEVLDRFIEAIGKPVLGNKAASGTEILEELGDLHMQTGKPIVYTSADSVFQIAAHEDVIPVSELYKMCSIAREILSGEHQVGRVIARPFIGENGKYTRTERRRDYPLPIPSETVMETLVKHGYSVYSVGKIDQIFNYQGITKSDHTVNNEGGIRVMTNFLREEFTGLMFVNLIEFDMIYGHRNDPYGYASALEKFDMALPDFQSLMGPNDVGMIVGDHGVDPTTPSTDHSREYVPLLVFGPSVKPSTLGIRSTFADVGATIAENFSVEPPLIGASFLREISE